MSEQLIESGERNAPDSLAGAPVDYLTPSDRPMLDEALAWCHQLATTHYENFHVATFFLPRRLRPHFDSLYAFCRVSDDLGDEVGDSTTSLRLLDEWGQMLDQCYDAPDQSRHPVFVALRETIVAHDLPRELFHDLLYAFRVDQVKTRYDTWNEIVQYSRYSANPVGRLVLMICGYRDEVRAQLSDKICTALQLANFWQDAVRDSAMGRRYIPTEYMDHFGVVEGQIEGRVFTPEFRSMMSDLVEYTRQILHEGSALCVTVDDELSVSLELFCKGGNAILDGIEAQDFDVLRGRPVVTRRKKLGLLAGALLNKLKANSTPASPAVMYEADSSGIDAWTAAAYRYCRDVARREAKNFYWAFRVVRSLRLHAPLRRYRRRRVQARRTTPHRDAQLARSLAHRARLRHIQPIQPRRIRTSHLPGAYRCPAPLQYPRCSPRRAHRRYHHGSGTARPRPRCRPDLRHLR